VMQTEAFVKDPVNVVVKEKHFVVKNFYNTLVKAARANFTDAKSQAERWIQAVVLPLEVQMKDHKAQLQSRLDNLAKINEKTSSINEQMAVVKAAELDIGKQREMIEGLIARVSEYAARASLEPETTTTVPGGPRPGTTPAELMQTTKIEPAAPKVEAPLISDDLMAHLGSAKPAAPAPAFDPMKTQKLPPGSDRTQRMGSVESTQRMDAAPKPAPAPAPAPEKRSFSDGEKTMKIPKLDPNYRPESPQKPGPDSTQRIEPSPNSTQRLDPSPSTTQRIEPSPTTTQKIDPTSSADPGANAEQTQRLDDSIWRLQEAKRILQGLNQK